MLKQYCSRHRVLLTGTPLQHAAVPDLDASTSYFGVYDGHGGPEILDQSINDLSKYESFFENWVDPQNVDWDDYSHNKDPWKQDFLGGWNLKKKWSCSRTIKTFESSGDHLYYSCHGIKMGFYFC